MIGSSFLSIMLGTNTTKPYASELINKLGLDGKEKRRRIELQNTENKSYIDVLTITHLRKSGVWRNYTDDYIGHSSLMR